MASLVLGVAGAAALGPVGLGWGGMLGMSGAQIGFLAGSMLGSSLTSLPDIQGPRLSDLKVQGSTYGAPIPIYYGTARGAGQVIWSSDLIETENEESSGGLGKGGPSQSVTTYTYSVNCAVGVCEGEIAGIRKIWANGDLIYDASVGNYGPTGMSENIRVYTGSETQTADSLIESYEGAGNVPAHRGMAYVVFENFQLEKYGNRIPNYSFEVVASGDVVVPTHQIITDNNVTLKHMIPHPLIDGLFLYTSADDGGLATNIYLHVLDPIAQTDYAIAIDVDQANTVSGFITYVDYGLDPITGLPILLNEIWVNTSRSNFFATNEIAAVFDVMSLSFKRRIIPTVAQPYNYMGVCLWDSSNYKVLFATNTSTSGAGLAYFDPYSLTWDAGFLVSGNANNWYTETCLSGENSLCMVNLSNYATFFSDGLVRYELTGASNTFMTYDTRRNRYACFSSNVSTFAVFRVWDEDGGLFSEDITTTNTGMVDGSALTYWPIADKYLYRNGDDVRILNADTFEQESTFTKDINSFEGINNYEIAMMPDYFLGFVDVSPTSDLAIIPITDRLDKNTVTLSSIVTDICDRVELAAGDIDVTQLTDEVDGYIIGQQMTARNAIEALQAAFYFDAVESN